jgi:hypothetical protein
MVTDNVLPPASQNAALAVIELLLIERRLDVDDVAELLAVSPDWVRSHVPPGCHTRSATTAKGAICEQEAKERIKRNPATRFRQSEYALPAARVGGIHAA